MTAGGDTQPAALPTTPTPVDLRRARARTRPVVVDNAHFAPLALALVFALFGVTLQDKGFLNAANLHNVLLQACPLIIMAVGVTYVLSAGELDLSFANVVGLASLTSALVLRDTGSPVVALSAALGVGVLVGLVNGLLVAQLRLPSFLVTLASAVLIAGVSRSLTEQQSVPVTDDRFAEYFGSGEILGVSTLVLWTALVVGLGHHVLRGTAYGSHVLALGDNPAAAAASGLRVRRLRMSVLVISGTTAALAGVLFAGRLTAGRHDVGEGDLMTVIAAVIVGGTRLFGGKGHVLGAVWGALLMATLSNGLILAGLSTSQQMVGKGLLILAAVAITLRESRS